MVFSPNAIIQKYGTSVNAGASTERLPNDWPAKASKYLKFEKKNNKKLFSNLKN